MKAQGGFSFIFVFSVCLVVSTLLLYVYQRSFYTFITIAERTQYVKGACATRSLMGYALICAQAHWNYIQAKKTIREQFKWYVDKQKQGDATCVYTCNTRGVALEVTLIYKNQKHGLYCMLHPCSSLDDDDEPELRIYDWKEV